MKNTPRAISKALVKKAQNGDIKAFEELELEGRNKVIGSLTKFIFDKREVEELYQIALIKAWHNISKFRNDSLFYTWLTRIALNGAKDWLRKSKRSKTNGLSEYMESRTSAGEVIVGRGEKYFLDHYGRNISCENQGYRNLILGEERARLDAVLALLPVQHREILRRFVIDEIEYKTIAKEFNIPIGTVMSRIHYAKQYAKRNLLQKHQSIYSKRCLKAASSV